MPTAEHHDGFKLYKSELNRWNTAEMGPKRDLLGDLQCNAGEITREEAERTLTRRY